MIILFLGGMQVMELSIQKLLSHAIAQGMFLATVAFLRDAVIKTMSIVLDAFFDTMLVQQRTAEIVLQPTATTTSTGSLTCSARIIERSVRIIKKPLWNVRMNTPEYATRSICQIIGSQTDGMRFLWLIYIYLYE